VRHIVHFLSRVDFGPDRILIARPVDYYIAGDRHDTVPLPYVRLNVHPRLQFVALEPARDFSLPPRVTQAQPGPKGKEEADCGLIQ